MYSKFRIEDMIRKEINKRGNVVNLYKGMSFDRRENKLAGHDAVDEKDDEMGPPVGSYPPIAT